jgi:hypothetical protein
MDTIHKILDFLPIYYVLMGYAVLPLLFIATYKYLKAMIDKRRKQ